MRVVDTVHDTQEISTAIGRMRICGKRVLYVDDDALLRKAMVRLLDRAGAICRPAGTHADAVTLLERDPHVDLVILDFHMPDGDVADLVPRLRSVRPDLTLIGTSGLDRQREFAACGVTRFIPKPWELEDLLRVSSP